MKRSRRLPRFCASLPLLLLSGCDALKLGVMNHAGPIAASQWHLYVIVGIVLVFVAGPVLLLTPLIAWHYRLSNKNSGLQAELEFLLDPRSADLDSAYRDRHRPRLFALELYAHARSLSPARLRPAGA